jgi:hypothetical protein
MAIKGNFAISGLMSVLWILLLQFRKKLPRPYCLSVTVLTMDDRFP